MSLSPFSLKLWLQLNGPCRALIRVIAQIISGVLFFFLIYPSASASEEKEIIPNNNHPHLFNSQSPYIKINPNRLGSRTKRQIKIDTVEWIMSRRNLSFDKAILVDS